MKLLSLTSLTLGFFGTWFLAYEIIWGYKKKLLARHAEVRLGYLKGDLETLKANTDKLSPVYTNDEIEKIKNGYNDNYKDLIKKEEVLISNATHNHTEDSALLAIIGAILISVSFFIQAYTTYSTP